MKSQSIKTADELDFEKSLQGLIRTRYRFNPVEAIHEWLAVS